MPSERQAIRTFSVEKFRVDLKSRRSVRGIFVRSEARILRLTVSTFSLVESAFYAELTEGKRLSSGFIFVF